MKKVLFITFIALEANSSVTKSNYGILQGLKELGYDPTIIMPDISRDLSYYDDSYNVNEMASKIVRMTNTNIGGTLSKQVNNSNGIKRKMLHMLRTVYYETHVFDRTKEYVSQADTIIRELDPFYDIVLTTSDPKASHLLVSKLAKSGLNYGKWIQHWGDPIMGDITRRTVLPDFILKRTEGHLIKQADKVVYVSPFTLKEQKKRYPEISRLMEFVPLPADLNIAEFAEKTHDGGKYRLAYLGDYHSNVRNILPLYNVVKMMSNVQLTIAGYSDLDLEGTSNIEILPRVSQNECNRIEKMADIIISIGNLRGTQIPGKLYYSSSNGKPILCIVDGEGVEYMKNYLDSYERFDCCFNTESSIKEKLEEIIVRNDKLYETPKALLPINVAKKIVS